MLDFAFSTIVILEMEKKKQLECFRDLWRVGYEGRTQSKYNKDSLSNSWILALMAILNGVSNKENNLAERGWAWAEMWSLVK